MPAKSKKQQRFMGMVHQCKKTGKCASKEVADVAGTIKKKDARDFAKTKHKGLPESTMKKMTFINFLSESVLRAPELQNNPEYEEDERWAGEQEYHMHELQATVKKLRDLGLRTTLQNVMDAMDMEEDSFHSAFHPEDLKKLGVV